MNEQEKQECIEILRTVFIEDKKIENISFLFDYYYKEEDVIFHRDDKTIFGFLFGCKNKKQTAKEKTLMEMAMLDNFKDGTERNYILYLRYNTLKLENHSDENDAFINLLAVSPNYQGKHIGRKLIEKYLDKCRKEGVEKVYLWTDLTCNYKFYKKVKFDIVETFYNPFMPSKIDDKPNTIIYCYSTNPIEKEN